VSGTETVAEPGGTIWDDPNQQVVREDQSPSWEQGTGAGGSPDPQKETKPADEDADEERTLDEMTKTELLEYAQARGYTPANASMAKDEIRAVIDDNEE
jgi:hypothetical protein